MYGLIFLKNKDYRIAEIFLRTVTDFHPLFVEGWVILHFFYVLIDYAPGIDTKIYRV